MGLACLGVTFVSCCCRVLFFVVLSFILRRSDVLVLSAELLRYTFILLLCRGATTHFEIGEDKKGNREVHQI